MDDPGTKARLRLWLRSEKAFGISAVQVPEFETFPEHQDLPAGKHIAAGTPAESASRPRPAPAPTAALFADALPAAAVVPPIPDPSGEPFTTPTLSRDEKIERLSTMNRDEVSVCKKCVLCQTRKKTVFGEGDPDAKILFIGEGPGETEDNTGRPFVGRAGELLNKMIAGMGLKREQVFIANVVKCRPPGNRVPMPDEVATCTPYLVRQLEIIRPKVIVTLGLPAVKYMLNNPRLTMGRIRGQWQSWRGIKLMPTYHPAFLLRAYTDDNRRAVWNDLQLVMGEVGLKGRGAKSE